MKHIKWLVFLLLFALLAGAQTMNAQVRKPNDAKLSHSASVAQSDDDTWHATFDPIVTNLITLDDQIRSMEVKLNDIAKIPDQSTRLLEVASFEKSVLNKEAEALKTGLDVIAKADSFVPTANVTNETREKTVLVIETKILLIIVRVVQIKSTIIIIKEGRVPPYIPSPTPVATASPAAKQANPQR